MASMHRAASRYGEEGEKVNMVSRAHLFRFLMVMALLALPSITSTAEPQSDLVKVRHEVAPSENIARIAARYGIPASDIQAWNNLSSMHAPVGTELTLYVDRDRAEAVGTSGAGIHRLIHTVKSDESLSVIAKKYELEVADLVTWNRLRSAELRAGQMLMLFVTEPVYQANRPAPRQTESQDSPITLAANQYEQGVAEAEAAQTAAAQSSGSPNFAAKPASVVEDLPEPVKVAEATEAPLVPVETAAAAPARSKVEIPESIQYPGSVAEETILIPTKDLHGYSEQEMRQQMSQRFAALSGAVLGQTGQHVSLAGFGEYIIDAGDILEFISFNDVSMSRDEVVVRYDGYVSLPLIPDIKVGGRTRTEAEALIKSAYGNIYRDPEISLVVTTPDSKQYTVIGDIAEPGRYPYTRPTTLNEAIFLAGGLRPRDTGGGGAGGFVGLAGQVTQAYIVRRIDGERVVIPHDLRGLIKSGDHEGDSPVYYGDLVYVPEGVNLVYLLGESNNTRIVELTEGMTLLQMLALSGGFDTRRARTKEIILLRQENETMSSVHKINLNDLLTKGSADPVLRPGDIVYLPTRRLLRLREWVEDFTGIISPWLELYNLAVDSYFRYDIQDETLTALENGNDIAIISRGAVPGITRVPALGR
jgi:polysaccharide biosynthesis/export protein